MLSTEINTKEQSISQDSDCWESLWQLIKTNGSLFLWNLLHKKEKVDE
jgi:hypothetical protein